MTIKGELRVPEATAQLVQFDFAAPVDNVICERDSYRLDLCLTPRPLNARACYPERWNSHRFEPIGNVFLVPPGEPMLALSDGCCRQASIVCQLHLETMHAWLDDRPRWTDRGLAANLDIRDRNIHSLLLRLAEETRNPGFASEMLVELIANQMAIELARYCNRSNSESRTGGLAPWRLRLIEQRLREEDTAPTLDELARLCRVSRRQLTPGFRESRGYTIGDVVASHRIEKAKRLLAAGDSIKGIAYALGFASASSFCYAFRRATGESPGRFRERLSRPV